MSTAVRTVYIEFRATAARLQQEMAGVEAQIDRAGKSGKQAGAQISAGMDQAHESFGHVVKSAGEAALAIDSVVKGISKYSAIAAASGTTTDGLVNTYRALRIALDPTPLTIATVAVGFLAEETIRLTNARAKLIEQQSLIAATSGLGIGSVQRIDAVTGISGGNAASARSLQAALDSRGQSAVKSGLDAIGISSSDSYRAQNDPDLLQKIAAGFASIEDPAKRAAAAVQLFGAENAGSALRELDAGFVESSSVVQRYGLTLDTLSRSQIYRLHQELESLQAPFRKLREELSGGGEQIKTNLEIITGAIDDLSNRGMEAFGRLLTGPGGKKTTGIQSVLQGLSGAMQDLKSLSAGDINKAARSGSPEAATADQLFAQAQLARFRKSQTLEGQQSLLAAYKEADEEAYKRLADDAKKRKSDPSDKTLMSDQERFTVVNHQQDAQAMVAQTAIRVKALEAIRDAEKNAAEAHRQATEELRATDDDQLASLKAMHALSVGEVIQYWQKRVAAESGNTDRVRAIGIILGNLYQDQDRVIQRVGEHGAALQVEQAKKLQDWKSKLESLVADAEALNERIGVGGTEPRERTSRLGAISSGADADKVESDAQAKKLALEREYGVQITQTRAQQISLMQKLAELDSVVMAAREAQLQADLDDAKASGDIVRIKQAQAVLDRQIAGDANAQYEAQTRIQQAIQAPKWPSYFARLRAEAKDSAQIMQESMTSAIDDIAGGLADLSTGKKANWGQMLQNIGNQMAKESIKSIMQRGLSSVFGDRDPATGAPRGGIFGGGSQGGGVFSLSPGRTAGNIPGIGPMAAGGFGKPDGTPTNPYYVVLVAQQAQQQAQKPSFWGTVLGSFLGALTGATIGGIGGGGGSSVSSSVSYPGEEVWSSISYPGEEVSSSIDYGDIAPRARGGNVSPADAYLVGEDGPEILTGMSGRIHSNSDSHKMLGGDTHNYYIDAAPGVSREEVFQAVTAAHRASVSTSVQANVEFSKRRPGGGWSAPR